MTLRLTGHTEHLILLAALRLGGDAYAVSIRTEIAQRAGVEISRGAVYVTLDRLADKGLLRSSFARPTPERGGKAKRVFEVTAAGRRALRQSWSALEKMHLGAELLGDNA